MKFPESIYFLCRISEDDLIDIDSKKMVYLGLGKFNQSCASIIIDTEGTKHRDLQTRWYHILRMNTEDRTMTIVPVIQKEIDALYEGHKIITVIDDTVEEIPVKIVDSRIVYL